MRPTFHPRLVNGPFGDPALLIRVLGMGKNLLFDLGDLHALPARPVLKVTHAFVSHAHVDHFCGFDAVVRYGLGRARALRLVGPPGFADRVEAKLGGYTWNLVASYEECFTVEVLECAEGRPEGSLSRFACREGFVRREAGLERLPELEEGVREVHRESALRVLATAMDHQVPSLAFALEEPLHVNVVPEALAGLELAPGPWVRGLKEAVFEGREPGTPVATPAGELPLGAFLERGAVLVTEGQKLAYVADCAFTEPGIAGAVALARGAHVLYCEAAFAAEDEARARDRHHLTTVQAGELARRAGVGELRVFHFSPKYRGREEELVAEAREAFGGRVRMGG